MRILEYACDSIEEIAERPPYFAHIYAMYLLAQFRETRAYPLLTQFFAIPGDRASDATGEVVTSDLCRILASVSGGDRRLMMELAENESADDYVRSAALQGLICLVVSGDKTREDVITYFQSFFRGRLPREYTVLWDLLVLSSTDLYPEELYEDIKQAYEEGLIESFFIGLEDVESTLNQRKERVLDDLRSNKQYSLITDTISELVTGQWVEAEAHIVDATTAEHGHTLLLQKYGWKKRLGNVFSGLMKRERVVMTIRLVE